MKSVAIVGGSGGIGAGIAQVLAQRDDISDIHTTYHQSPLAGSLGSDGSVGAKAKLHSVKLDATDEEAVAYWLRSMGSVDWLINCVGMLHDQKNGPEKTITAFDTAHFNKSLEINTLPTLLLGKYAKNLLKDSPHGVFATISARVGSISDNRLGGWYSYRASKAALNMVLKCLSIEWGLSAKNIRVAALHPGTTDTRLSKPFQKHVAADKLFSCEKTATLLVEQIESLALKPSGRFVAYDGEEIPW
ncbi:MAG: SDR family NAD(P)-dependent oxidoreductase [Granulosicoccus sp.]